jgi:hypothetical protein
MGHRTAGSVANGNMKTLFNFEAEAPEAYSQADESMGDRFVFETGRRIGVDWAAKGLGSRGRWIRQGSKIIVLPGIKRVSEDYELYELFDNGIPAATPRVLTYSTRDVIDARISVPAQHSLVRLSKNPETSADAVGMLEEVKARRLAGIYCVNWQNPSQRALRFGKAWWTVIPPSEDAILILDPGDPLHGPPLIAFRRELDPNCGQLAHKRLIAASPARLDAALLKVWSSFRAMQSGEPALCPVPRPGNGIETELPMACIANVIPPIVAQMPPASSKVCSARLCDLTDSPEDYVHVGEQNGRAFPADKGEISCGNPSGKGALPLLPVLNTDPSACGMNRLLTTSRALPNDLRGTLRVLAAKKDAASASPPRLFLIWIPDRLDLGKTSKVIDFHVSLHAQPTGAGKIDYPLGIETFQKSDGTTGRRQPYVIKGFQQLMWRTWGNYQHDLAQRACVYVAPVAPDSEMFTKLTAATLAGWLEEIAELVRLRVVPASHAAKVAIGKVALSGFSRGATWVRQVLLNAGDAKGAEFLRRNLEEVYLFDPVPGTDAAVRGWQKIKESSGIVRVYTQRQGIYENFRPLVQTAKGQQEQVRFRNAPIGEAREVNSPKGSAVWVSGSLLVRSVLCKNPSVGCGIPFSQDAHGWFVMFFMAHALNHSRFDRL